MKKFLVIFLVFTFFNCNITRAADGFKHGIAVFDKLKYPANFKYFDYVNPDAPKGGSVVFGVEGTFNSLNPFILKGIAAANIDTIYDALTEGSEDEISARYGLIAESMRLSQDRLALDFKLRKNAYWHDNRPITADDVIFTFNILINHGHPSYKIAYSLVKEVKKINDYQVQFLFKDNQNRDLPLLVASMKILPKHYYQNRKFDETNMDFPLGSGPYKIKQVDAGKKIIYERKKDYWGKDLALNKGRNNFDEIIYDYYRDNNVLIEAFKASKFDFRQENTARNWYNSYNIEKIKNGEIIKKEIRHSLPAPMQAFIINLRRQKFADVNLRKALTYAFDFEWLNKHVFYSSYKRTESYFANSKFSYNTNPSHEPFELPKSDGFGFGRKNLVVAKQILDQAGYKIINQKLIDPRNNQPINIEFLIDSEKFEMVIAPFIKNLQKLGIAARMRLVEENQYQARLHNFDYDIIVGVYGQSLIAGSELLRYWHSSQKDNIGSQNYAGLANKQVDEIVEKISQAKREEDLILLTRKLDYILLSNYYTIPQWHNNSFRLLYRDIFAMPKIQPQYGLAIDSWWIKDKSLILK